MTLSAVCALLHIIMTIPAVLELHRGALSSSKGCCTIQHKRRGGLCMAVRMSSAARCTLWRPLVGCAPSCTRSPVGPHTLLHSRSVRENMCLAAACSSHDLVHLRQRCFAAVILPTWHLLSAKLLQSLRLLLTHPGHDMLDAPWSAGIPHKWPWTADGDLDAPAHSQHAYSVQSAQPHAWQAEGTAPCMAGRQYALPPAAGSEEYRRSAAPA